MNKQEFVKLMSSTGMRTQKVREDTLLFATAEDVMLVFTEIPDVIYVTGWKREEYFSRSYHEWGSVWDDLPTLLISAHDIA